MDEGLYTIQGKAATLTHSVGHPFRWIVVMLLVVAAAISFEVGTFIWTVVGAIVAGIAAFFAFFAWRVEHDERQDRLRTESERLQFHKHPFVNVNCWLSTLPPKLHMGVVYDVFVEAIKSPPAFSKGTTPTLPLPVHGKRLLVLQLFAENGLEVIQVNLRFMETLGHPDKPIVTWLGDPEPKTPNIGHKADSAGGWDFWYTPPKPIMRRSALFYVAAIDCGDNWEGVLSLQVDLGWGESSNVRIPVSVVYRLMDETLTLEDICRAVAKLEKVAPPVSPFYSLLLPGAWEENIPVDVIKRWEAVVGKVFFSQNIDPDTKDST